MNGLLGSDFLFFSVVRKYDSIDFYYTNNEKIMMMCARSNARSHDEAAAHNHAINTFYKKKSVFFRAIILKNYS
jgi:hypothetical protein